MPLIITKRVYVKYDLWDNELIIPALSRDTGKILLPFPRDKHFTERSDVIDRIKTLLNDAAYSSRVALVGLGGVG